LKRFTCADGSAIEYRIEGKGRPIVFIHGWSDESFLSTLSEADRKEFEFLSVVQTAPMWREYKRDIHLEIHEGNEGFLESRLDGAFSRAIDVSDVPYDRPALILLGRQDTEVGFEDQVELYAKYERATIQVLDKAGHNLQIERRGVFNASFLDWLERVETFYG